MNDRIAASAKTLIESVGADMSDLDQAKRHMRCFKVFNGHNSTSFLALLSRIVCTQRTNNG
jgi:hypothetical protein